MFASDSELNENGKAVISFGTTHLSTFAVVSVSDSENSPVSVSQEHTAEDAASVAQTPVQSQGQMQPIVLIIIGTIIVLSAGAVASDRKNA